MIGDCEFAIEDCLAQISMLDSGIGAWEYVDSIGALERARQLDRTEIHGPLHGMAIGMKDIIDVGGMPTRCGTPIYALNMAKMDATCVALAKAAGAIIIGKTATTELAGSHPTKTRNPQNTEFTPGGSSSGSAAAVSSGMVPMAFGTQTAGSVIRPAAYCGVVGFKPTFGLVPRGGVKLQSETLDTIGVFTRTVDDVMKWYAAMTGSRSQPIAEPATDRPLRITIVTNLMDHADVDMSVAIAEAADALSAGGAKVRETRLPNIIDDAQKDQRIIQLVELARHYAIEHRNYRSQLSDAILALLDEGSAIPQDDYLEALKRTEAARKQADFLLGDCDAWLMPSATGAAPKGLTSTGDPVFNRLTTTLHVPAINLPVYRSKKRMPLGLQLIGSRHQDEKLLATARRAIEIMRNTTHG
jgi:Asp-tRNA(Asn)/Glu-tRNA(Gln) amidotransferase A subunit family amidase